MNAKHDLLVMEDSDRVGPFWRVVGPLRGTRAEAEADLAVLGSALARPGNQEIDITGTEK